MQKKKRKSDKLPVAQLEQRIRQFLRQTPTATYNAKELAEKLGVANNRDSMEHILSKLAEEGFIVITHAGKIKMNRPDEDHAPQQPAKTKSQDRFATGIVDITRSGAAYIVSSDSGSDKDIFVPQGRLGNALHGDKVSVRWWLSSRGKAEGEVVRVLERHTEQFIGTLVISKQFAFVIPDSERMPYDILVEKVQKSGAVDGDKVIVGVKQWHTPKGSNTSPAGEIVAVLGKSGSSDVEMQSILLEHGFPLTFPEDVMRENDAIAEDIPQSEIDKRTDFRTITTFTIDPLTAKDFDDALSIRTLENGNYEIGVHIADVSHYVTPNSALDKEASKRTTSVYLVDRVLPMLPEKLSNGVCSLRPNEDKLTFSSVFEFTPKGDMVGEWFGKTVIHSDRRFTYEEVQTILEEKKGEFADELQILNRFAQKMRKERFKKGAFNFESPEVQFRLDEHGKPLGVYTKIRKDAHFLVEDFMLLANKRVATFIVEQFKETGVQIPFVYRIHDLPDMEKVANFIQFAGVFGYELKVKNPMGVAKAFGDLLKKTEGAPEHDILQQLAIRTMAKAEYSIHNIGHYGLAFENYSHFTSPIRRYSDVLAHRILFEYLQKKPLRINTEKLEETCSHISKKERKAMEAERASVKYKQVEFIQDHVGSVFSGVITGMTERGIFVELRENRCEGMISFDNMYEEFILLKDGFHIKSASRAYKMGDVVWAKVLSANLTKRQIDFALLEEADVEETYPELWQAEQLRNAHNPHTTAAPIETESAPQTETVVPDATATPAEEAPAKPKRTRKKKTDNE